MTQSTLNFIIMLFCLLALDYSLYGQWNGKKAAVAFTYDDALDQHLDLVVPLLDSMNLKGTFYVAPVFSPLNKRVKEWQKIAIDGHELGNHTLFHPCDGGAGREWVKPEQDLRKYSLLRMTDEVLMANNFLKLIDGKTKRSFAFTCGDRFAEGEEFIKKTGDEITGARAVRNTMSKIQDINVLNLDGYMVNNQSFEEMKSWVDQALNTNSLLIFIFHGVGGGHSLDCNLENHRKIVKYVASKRKEIYVAPVNELAVYIHNYQNKKH
jgi:peptidoglycan/xylan/chitin deacetylase (PgdA/CDA1 family)